MANRKRRNRMGRGSVYANKTTPGLWVGEVRIEKKRYRVSARTKVDAGAKLAALIRQIETGETDTDEAAPEPDETLTVDQLVADWLARDIAGRDLAASTVNRHRWASGLVCDLIGRRKAAKVTTRMLDDALDAIHTRDGLSRGSFNQIRSSMRLAYKFGIRRGDVTTNPADAVTLPVDAARAERADALDPADARELLLKLRTLPGGAQFGISLLIGLRPGEAAGLYWDDLDLEQGLVNVRRGRQSDARGQVFVDDSLKTVESRRTIGLPAELVEWLSEHRKQQAADRLAATRWDDPELVFASATGTVRSPSNDRRTLAGVCESITADRRQNLAEAEAFPTVKPNQLRHSAASLLLDDGQPIELVADLLGHTTTRMLDTTYRHRLRPSIDVAKAVTWTEAK